MDHDQWIETIVNGIHQTTQGMDKEQILAFAQKISDAPRIFLFGIGRTGLITQTFGMRLTQLGLPVYLVSHPTTPALEENDFLVLISGSGNTASIQMAAERAQQLGVETFLVTQREDSQLGKKIQNKLIIQSSPEDNRVLNGTLFEMALLITLDAVINQLLGITGQTFEDLSARHANLE